MVRFMPSVCPYETCPSKRGRPFRFHSRGSYQRRCDGRVVPKFHCLSCRRHFSLQSFRLDFGLRKPWLNCQVAQQLCAKTTLRKTAEILGVRRPTVERRLRLFGDHCRQIHTWLLEQHKLERGGVPCPTVLMDELETFETDRRVQPVTVPILIDRSSYFVIHVETAPMAPRGALSGRALERKERLELEIGRRRSGSRAAITRTLRAWRDQTSSGHGRTLITDKKRTYRSVLREVFPGQAVAHATIKSTETRDYKNPLFPINHTNALFRDSVSRLVRRSWGVSKRREHLESHLWLFVVFRNLIRGITRKAWKVTAGMAVGLVERKLRWGEVLRWRAPFFASLLAT